MTDKTSLAKTYLAASEHDQGSTLWMQSRIMDHLAHYDIDVDDFWEEVRMQSPAVYSVEQLETKARNDAAMDNHRREQDE